MGILSGLGGFGLGNLENTDIFNDNKNKTSVKEETVEKTAEVQESDLLFEKTNVCPVCDLEFKAKTVKIGKAKLIGTDLDLRPKYETVDSLKYDVILCPRCGYAALSRYFKFVTAPQIKLIQTHISQGFHDQPVKGDIYTYDEAIERHKLALANAIVKRGKSSEKAYICLKLAWILRGKAENLSEEDADYEAQKAKCLEEENELLRNSLEGFLAARQSESFPMCGMDESTVDYLIAVMSMKFDQLDVATKLVSNIILSPTTNPRMKEKARNVKEMLIAQIRKQKQQGGE